MGMLFFWHLPAMNMSHYESCPLHQRMPVENLEYSIVKSALGYLRELRTVRMGM